MNIFEKATREKIRFNYRGTITVEDLWDLPVEALDDIFKSLNARLKESQSESLLSKKTSDNDILETKIEIIKYIVTIKLAEAEAREKAYANAAKKQKILEIIKEKQDADLKGMSIEELQAMITNL